MQIIDCKQKTEEWFKLRDLRMTASHAQAISANGKGLDTYIQTMMQEYYSTAEPERYTNINIDRGNELEDSAALAYTMETGRIVEKIGFVVHSDYAGCSPDLFVEKTGLAEIKCPADKAYFQMLLDEADGELKIETKYIWQMQMQMMICEKEWCDFVAYNPNYEKFMIVKRVVPDKKAVEKIRMGLISGEEKIKLIQQKMETISK